MANLAGVPERPKGAGCKPAGSAYEGSNPSPCTYEGAIGVGICGSRSRPAPRPLKGRFAPENQRDDPVRGRLDCGDPALLAQLVEHLHGKEGVDGSSPSEGLYEMSANGDFMLPVVTRFRFFAGTRRVHFGTGGHPRARATPRDTAWDVLETLDRDHLLEKFLQNRLGGVAHTDATLTPSFAREGGLWLRLVRHHECQS